MIGFDYASPTKLLGTCLLVAACVDITTSEGLAAIARLYLRSVRPGAETDKDESSPPPD